MQYYNEIKNQLINNEINRKVKNYAINKSDLETYYNVGKLLSDAGKHYGEGIIKEYSKRLMKEVNKKYSERSLRRMRQFFIRFNNLKWSPLASTLSYSHFIELLSINDDIELYYYIDKSIKDNLDNKAIGIILYKENNQLIIKYTSDERIIARKYELL